MARDVCDRAQDDQRGEWQLCGQRQYAKEATSGAGGATCDPMPDLARTLAYGREELSALLLAVVATAFLGLGATTVWNLVTPGVLSMAAL